MPKCFYMVWREAGDVPNYIHDSRSSAIEEAKRLSKKEGGKFFILQSIGTVEVPPDFVWIPHDDIPF